VVAFLISQQILLFQIPKADIIFINEKIWTFGTNAEVKKYADKNTKIVDLKGRLMLPVFSDGHMNPRGVFGKAEDSGPFGR
jgi:predicted amidohydrolase YtcJ